MKWFRHESDAHTNLKLTQILQEYGIGAYGYYWFLLELVCQQSENFRVKAGKNWKKFAEVWTHLDIKSQDNYLRVFAELNLIDKKALKSGTLYIPKLQERLDDYTKRVRRLSEHKPNNVPLQDNTIHNKIYPAKADYRESPKPPMAKDTIKRLLES